MTSGHTPGQGLPHRRLGTDQTQTDHAHVRPQSTAILYFDHIMLSSSLSPSAACEALFKPPRCILVTFKSLRASYRAGIEVRFNPNQERGTAASDGQPHLMSSSCSNSWLAWKMGFLVKSSPKMHLRRTTGRTRDRLINKTEKTVLTF